MKTNPIKYKDYPIAECIQNVNRLRQENQSINAYQKFSCEKCGQRLTMEAPNIFYDEGTCDRCGHVTNIAKTGCNYRLVFGIGA